MKPHIKLETIRVRPKGPCTGIITLKADDDSDFPEPEWNDFVEALLVSWAQKTRLLLEDKSDSETLNFMEGPHKVEIARLGDIWTAAYRSSTRTVKQESPFNLAEFAAALVDQCQAVEKKLQPYGKSIYRDAAFQGAVAALSAAITPAQ